MKLPLFFAPMILFFSIRADATLVECTYTNATSNQKLTCPLTDDADEETEPTPGIGTVHACIMNLSPNSSLVFESNYKISKIRLRVMDHAEVSKTVQIPATNDETFDPKISFYPLSANAGVACETKSEPDDKKN